MGGEILGKRITASFRAVIHHGGKQGVQRKWFLSERMADSSEVNHGTYSFHHGDTETRRK
jgi:hypothetical protein